jgi:hypothetical protein
VSAPDELIPSLLDLCGFTSDGAHQLCGIRHARGNCPLHRSDGFVLRAAQQLRWIRKLAHQDHKGPANRCRWGICQAVTDTLGD